MNLRPEQRLTRRPDVLSRVLDGEAVLLDLKTGVYFGLNEVGAAIWEQLADGATVAEVTRAIVATYQVDQATAESDLEQLVGELHARGLVAIEE